MNAASSEESRVAARKPAELTFLPVSRITHQHEIASDVADDIELLACAALSQVKNLFVEQLYSAYLRDGFAIPLSSRPRPNKAAAPDTVPFAAAFRVSSAESLLLCEARRG